MNIRRVSYRKTCKKSLFSVNLTFLGDERNTRLKKMKIRVDHWRGQE